MSLIKCPICEKEISPNAPACPHCGEPMNVQKTRTLIVRQQAKRVQIYTIMLDGRPIGTVGPLGTFKCEISTESHTLYPMVKVDNPLYDNRDPRTIEIPAGEDPISYEFAWKAGFIRSEVWFERTT